MGKQDRFYENKHKKERRNAACPELNNEIYIEKARHRVVPFALSTIAGRYSKHHSGYHFSAFPLRGGGNALLMIEELDDGRCMSGMSACVPL